MKRKLDLKTKKGKLILFGGLFALVTIAVAVAVPVALLVPAKSSSVTNGLTPAQVTERDAFLAKYPRALALNDTAIESSAFYGEDLPADFTLPSFIKRIGNFAFAGATLPDGFALPAGLKSVHASSFAFTTLPEGFALPDSVNFIGQFAFLGAIFKGAFTLPASLTELGMSSASTGRELTGKESASKRAEVLKQVYDRFAPFAGAVFEKGLTIPATLKNIADNTFSVEERPDADTTGLPGLRYVQLVPTSSLMPLGFHIPATVNIWKVTSHVWSEFRSTVLKVRIPPKTKWENDSYIGASAGATVVVEPPKTNGQA